MLRVCPGYEFNLSYPVDLDYFLLARGTLVNSMNFSCDVQHASKTDEKLKVQVHVQKTAKRLVKASSDRINPNASLT
jgi:hypothetical protein